MYLIQDDLSCIRNLLLVSKEWNRITQFSKVTIPDNWSLSLTSRTTISEFCHILMTNFRNFRGVGNIKTRGLYFTPLHEAVEEEDTKSLEMYLKNGANPDIQTRGFGYTALHKAVYSGNLGMAQILLEFGANKEIVSKTGNKAYDVAVRNGHQQIADLLQ